MAHATNKLRRATQETTPSPPVQDVAPSVTWRGISLQDLGLALSQTHHITYIWKQLAQVLSTALEDHAVALTQIEVGIPTATILADDGLHDELRKAIASADQRCPFLLAPQQHINDLGLVLNDDTEARRLYEFIEHYWGWELARNKETSIFLMLFGPETCPPNEMARNVCRLATFVASHAGTEKRRHQLIADLSAEMQGRRIPPAVALRDRLDHWISLNDGAQ
jgi:hypothetical protein